MESLIGRTLGKYELTAMIGGGGMATVYEARHPGLNQQVAVKILHPFLSTDPSFVDRFRREAHAVAALRHPNIVRVLDFDHEEHIYYMVMEYIGGPTLSTVLSGRKTSGGLSLPEIGRIFSPLCAAIDYAASRGMVHRDIKPANIIMSDDGEPILTDYGIAKMIGSTSITSPGTVVGSAHYMSPEQAQGQDCDVRSDLYSLGIVLFECLSGAVPFDGDTTVTVLIKHISAPIPSIRALRPNLPPAVEPMLTRALAKQPRERYEMGISFAEELMTALTPTKSTLPVTEVLVPAAILAETVLSETPPPPVTPPPVEPPPPLETPPPSDAALASAAAVASGAAVASAAAVASETMPLSEIPPPPSTPVSAPPTSPEPPVTPPAPTPDSTAVEQPVVGATRIEALPVVESVAVPAMTQWEAPPTPPPTPVSTPAGSITSLEGEAPVGQYDLQAPPTAAVPDSAAPSAGGKRGGVAPRRGNRKRVIVVAVLAVVLVAAIGAGATFALQGGSTESTTTLSVTTTGTTSLSTTTSAPTTSTTVMSTTTAKPITTVRATTTTTAKPTTTTAKATTTTKKVTTTTRRPTTTQRPTTTTTAGPPPTIGP